MAKIAISTYPSKQDAGSALLRQIQVHLDYKRATFLNKAVRVGTKTFIQLTLPRLGTAAMEILARNELHRHVPIPNHRKGLNMLLIAITKKCPLQCAHCSEWDNLNQKERLSADDVLLIIRKFQSNGVASIEISGGEPLNRFADLLRILEESDTQKSEFWILSSGYRLTAEKATALQERGLVGVCISLDHWDPEQHDLFRGKEGIFDWAMQAAQNARDAGLVVCFSLTALRSFCNLEDLMRYAKLAKDQGAHFIRIMEPRAVGHFAGKDIELGPAEFEVLENFTKTLQTSAAYRDYPIVDYYGAYQRHAGCSGAGQRFMYVDTDGDYHACPFCQNKCGNALSESIEQGEQKMKLASGCHAYETV